MKYGELDDILFDFQEKYGSKLFEFYIGSERKICIGDANLLEDINPTSYTVPSQLDQDNGDDVLLTHMQLEQSTTRIQEIRNLLNKEVQEMTDRLVQKVNNNLNEKVQEFINNLHQKVQELDHSLNNEVQEFNIHLKDIIQNHI
ncbi:34066_t:CDS:2 [Gigaspora margarita]|uniref:34066_t:CDS:1 n=1 Tax=Gigaspora margarita TaxID=4874 RepID=A0ABN7UV28_GIGMA|nr:34066_t:CDS:2 [Gigaspora margarita]